jgi:hypothetical protein
MTVARAAWIEDRDQGTAAAAPSEVAAAATTDAAAAGEVAATEPTTPKAPGISSARGQAGSDDRSRCRESKDDFA